MRNIIFRGKCINRNGEWGYGDLRRYDGNTWVFSHNQDAAYDADMVDPSTVGQYTCLTDKNGTKIFEGDILSTNSTVLSKLIVHWFERCGGFFLSDSKDIDASSLTPIYSVNLCKYVVIGNIYDNPELLKQE